MFGYIDQTLKASEQMMSRTKAAAWLVPSTMVKSTYYVSGALTGITLGVVTTAADVIGTMLCDSDKVEIDLTAEDLMSIASDQETSTQKSNDFLQQQLDSSRQALADAQRALTSVEQKALQVWARLHRL